MLSQMFFSRNRHSFLFSCHLLKSLVSSVRLPQVSSFLGQDRRSWDCVKSDRFDAASKAAAGVLPLVSSVFVVSLILVRPLRLPQTFYGKQRPGFSDM